ncbi:MAG: enolase C-terminal domain-like protein [Solirubrobacterales bacterium]
MEDRGGISGAALIDRPAEPARSRTTRVTPKVEGLEVTAYEVPTDQPESDGTLKWDSTTAIVVQAFNGRERGIGYTYGDRSVKTLIESKLCDVVSGADAMRPPTAWVQMRRALRNVGQPGEGAMAVSAVDMALWDLKSRLLGLPLADALPRFRDSVPVYGSGGFTSYDADALREQARGWVRAGMRSVKIKVGREPDADPERIKIVRDVIGPNIELMVDANGAYGSVAEALQHAERFRELGIVWLEEPLPNDDLPGLHRVRRERPPGIEIAAGEYNWSLFDAERLLSADAVDVLQSDVTRCGGVTELLRIDGVCRAHGVPFSGHCAPAASAHACCAVESVKHLEYFHDHVRVESLLFEGTLDPEGGALTPDGRRAGLGLELRSEAERFRAE